MRRFTFFLLIFGGLIFSTMAFGEGRDSAAVVGGITWPENVDTTWYAAASARFHIEDNWAIEPDFGIWQKDDAERLKVQNGDIIYSLRDYHLGASLLFMGTYRDIGMYAGGGAAAHWRKRETSQDVVPPSNNPDLEETRLGLQALFGIDVPVAKKLDVTAAVRNDFVFRGDLDTLTYLTVYAGLRFYWE